MKPFFLSLIFVSLTIQSFAQSDSTSRLMFILDASGSMWQKTGNEHKITVAKTVLKDLVQNLPVKTNAGLVAYGHNRNSDCDDIETLVSLGPLDKAAFLAKLNNINPQGKTPIAKSILHTLALIKNEKQPITIILISDGLETCEGNACDLVRKAREQGVKITLHVVGFGIEEQDISTLECIAQAGGGQYLPASNAGELSEALEKTIESPVLDGGYLSVKVTLEGKLVDATVKVYEKGAVKESVIGRTYAGTETNPRILLLPPGEYRAEVAAITLDGKPVQKLENLIISHHDTLYKEIEFAKGSFEILVTRNGALSDAVIVLYKSGTREVATQTRSYVKSTTNPVKFDVLPGLYDVEISSVEIEGKPLYRYEKQLLAAGARISLAQHFQSGELKVGATQGSSLVDATVSIVSKKSGNSIANGRTYQSATSNPKTFILEPGEYEVRLNAVNPKELGKKNLTVKVTEKGVVTVTAEW
jgi:Ca-activated chloride channel family protein